MSFWKVLGPFLSPNSFINGKCYDHALSKMASSLTEKYEDYTQSNWNQQSLKSVENNSLAPWWKPNGLKMKLDEISISFLHLMKTRIKLLQPLSSLMLCPYLMARTVVTTKEMMVSVVKHLL